MATQLDINVKAAADIGALQKLNVELNRAANSTDQLGRNFRSMAMASGFAGSAFGNVTSQLTSILKAAMTFEDTMAKASALVGADSPILDNMRRFAMSAQGLEHGPNALAEGIANLARAGIEGQQALTDIKVVADVATVSQLSMASAADHVANAFKAWGNPVTSSAQILNQFVTAADMSTFALGNLMGAMQQAQRVSLQFGIGLAPTLAAVTLMAPVTGANSKAGSAWGSFLQRLGDKRVQKKYQELGIDALGMASRDEAHMIPVEYLKKQKSMSYAKAAETRNLLFGKFGGNVPAGWERAMQEGVTDENGRLIRGADAIKTQVRMISQGKMSLADKAKLARDNPAAYFKMLQADLERMLIDVGNSFFSTMKEIGVTLQPLIKGFQGLVHAAGPAIPAVLGISAALMGLTALKMMVPGALSSLINMAVGGRYTPIDVGGRIPQTFLQNMLGVGGGAAQQGLSSFGNLASAFSTAKYAADGTKIQGSWAERARNAMGKIGAYQRWEPQNFTNAFGEQKTSFRQVTTPNPLTSAIGSAAGGLASFGVGIVGLLGPMAGLAAITYLVTDYMEKQQEKREQQQRESARTSTAISAFPMLLEMAKGISGTYQTHDPGAQISALFRDDPAALSRMGVIMHSARERYGDVVTNRQLAGAVGDNAFQMGLAASRKEGKDANGIPYTQHAQRLFNFAAQAADYSSRSSPSDTSFRVSDWIGRPTAMKGVLSESFKHGGADQASLMWANAFGGGMRVQQDRQIRMANVASELRAVRARIGPEMFDEMAGVAKGERWEHGMYDRLDVGFKNKGLYGETGSDLNYEDIITKMKSLRQDAATDSLFTGPMSPQAVIKAVSDANIAMHGQASATVAGLQMAMTEGKDASKNFAQGAADIAMVLRNTQGNAGNMELVEYVRGRMSDDLSWE